MQDVVTYEEKLTASRALQSLVRLLLMRMNRSNYTRVKRRKCVKDFLAFLTIFGSEVVEGPFLSFTAAGLNPAPRPGSATPFPINHVTVK